MRKMEMEMLDWIMVPTGLGLLVAYHGWLLHRIIPPTPPPPHPTTTTTVIGINSINRRFWVSVMMEDMKNGVLAVQTLRNNLMASTLFASTAIMMSSVIAVLMSPSRASSTTSPHEPAAFEVVLGDRSPLGTSIKFFSILLCFLLNVQSIRYYSHASILVNVPFKTLHSPYLTADYVARIVNQGSYFWSLGLRAFYFSFPLFLWIFGPIPMFVSCLVLALCLYFLDSTSEFRAVETADVGEIGDSDVEQQPR